MSVAPPAWAVPIIDAPAWSPQDRALILLLIDVRGGKVGILTALHRIRKILA